MNSKLLFGIVGVLLIAMVACKRAEAPQAPPSEDASSAAPAPAPAPAPVPAAAPAPAPEPKAEETAKDSGVTREKKIYETTTGKEPVPTEKKFEGKEGAYVSRVECGVKDELATVSIMLQNPTEGSLKLGDRPQVFENGESMIGLRLNGRYVLDYLECKDYDKEAGVKSGEKVTCLATVPPDSNKEKVLIRHALTALGNPTPNVLYVYSVSGGREQVTFEC